MKRKRKRKSCPAKESPEEALWEAARSLSEDAGISYSEALGFTLGITHPTYGWENDLTDEEYRELVERWRQSSAGGGNPELEGLF